MDYWFTGGNPNASPQTTSAGATGQVQTVPLHVHSGLNAASRSGIGLAGNPARSRSNCDLLAEPA